MSDVEFVPTPPPASLEAGGQALWHGIADSFVLMPEQLVQLEEACRAKDRLDRLNLILSGEVETWARLTHRTRTDDYEIVIDDALAKANATANLLKQLLAALRLPDEEGRRPQYRGARGAQAPSTPGGAQKPGSAASRASSRWGT